MHQTTPTKKNRASPTAGEPGAFFNARHIPQKTQIVVALLNDNTVTIWPTANRIYSLKTAPATSRAGG